MVVKSEFTPANKLDCIHNWLRNPSSKIMDATAILYIARNSVPQRKFVRCWIVSDNDNVIRAHLHHKKDNLRDKDKLPEWVYGHCKKVSYKVFLYSS